MKNRYSKVIRTYFADYVSWLLAVFFLFIVSFAASVALNGVNKWIWVIPGLFVIIFLLSSPLLILYCKVNQDIKAGNIEKITVKTWEIQHDDRFTFKNRGGASVGRQKYRIVDENHNVYLLSTSCEKDIFMIFHPHPVFYIEIEVLKKSGLVLSMKIIENDKTTKDASKQQSIKHFKKIFSHYF
jgi:hypothetical protein